LIYYLAVLTFDRICLSSGSFCGVNKDLLSNKTTNFQLEKIPMRIRSTMVTQQPCTTNYLFKTNTTYNSFPCLYKHTNTFESMRMKLEWSHKNKICMFDPSISLWLSYYYLIDHHKHKHFHTAATATVSAPHHTQNKKNI
jgi:hypothetical protein